MLIRQLVEQFIAERNLTVDDAATLLEFVGFADQETAGRMQLIGTIKSNGFFHRPTVNLEGVGAGLYTLELAYGMGYLEKCIRDARTAMQSSLDDAEQDKFSKASASGMDDARAGDTTMSMQVRALAGANPGAKSGGKSGGKS